MRPHPTMSPGRGTTGIRPGYESLAMVKSPHGEWVRVLANPIALKAAREGKKILPGGAIIMKENYDKDKKLVALTPMYRVKGFNPEGGDWFWVKYAPDGTAMAEGKIQGCIDCHATVKDTDWRFLPFEL
jgi:hypothetical protein